MAQDFSEYFPLVLNIALYILVILIFINYVISFYTILIDGREVHSKYVWLLILVLFPIIGYIFYLFLGKNTRNPGLKKLIKQKEEFSETLYNSALEQNQKELMKKFDNEEYSRDRAKLVTLTANTSLSYLQENNSVQLIQSGEVKFRLLKEDLRNAERYIHLDYYIWRNDALTREIRDILIEKAKNGVEIRILVDHVGSFSTPKSYFRPMIKAGIQFDYSYMFRDFFKIKDINFRDHRKIVIIDGEIAYLGGMNMGQEYIDGGKQFSGWRDTHLRIKGEQVIYLQRLFALIWGKFIDEKLESAKYLPLEHKVHGNTMMQISTSGPESAWNSIEQIYFQMISDANEVIRIQSPYFIPSESLLAAMKAAALSGIKVKLMMTGIPDNYLVFWGARRYMREVIEAGVEVFLYKKCYFHSKTIAVDSKYCSIGTANMDMRSLRLDYEINAVIYDKKLTMELEEDFEEELNVCVQVKEEAFANQSTFKRVRDELCALLTPIL